MSTHRGSSVQLKMSGPSYSCPGDSGGSVYTNSGNRLVVIGVNSWGNCDVGVGYAESVGQHLQWIQKAAHELRSEAEL